MKTIERLRLGNVEVVVRRLLRNLRFLSHLKMTAERSGECFQPDSNYSFWQRSRLASQLDQAVAQPITVSREQTGKKLRKKPQAVLLGAFDHAEAMETMSLMDLYNQMVLKVSDRRLHDTPIPMTKQDKKQLFALFLKHQQEFMKGPAPKKTKFSKPNRSSRLLMSHIPPHLFGAV
uniref:SRP_SPB domain-containing protein n=1 Tax=Steinernema glaseri TaxID=37863 RepID=A0A1I7ZVW4_9BILA